MQEKPVLHALKVLIHTHTQFNADRLANVQKVVNNPLGKEVIKRKTDTYGEKELPTEHLLGQDLGDWNKKSPKKCPSFRYGDEYPSSPEKVEKISRFLPLYVHFEARMWLQRAAFPEVRPTQP